MASLGLKVSSSLSMNADDVGSTLSLLLNLCWGENLMLLSKKWEGQAETQR